MTLLPVRRVQSGQNLWCPPGSRDPPKTRGAGSWKYDRVILAPARAARKRIAQNHGRSAADRNFSEPEGTIEPDPFSVRREEGVDTAFRPGDRLSLSLVDRAQVELDESASLGYIHE